ncbi:hypothetical protein N9937_00795 [bacterium]|nr:hypothetical protein [bacterium]
MTQYYTGVGARGTPPEAMKQLQAIGYVLKDLGVILRSGGALGADTAFWEGVVEWYKGINDVSSKRPEGIYLPWEGFNGYNTWNQWGCFKTVEQMGVEQEARNIASVIHPAWYRCREGAQKMHSRNVLQVLGDDLKTPSDLLVCWAEVDHAGIPKGGTATAWNLAVREGIPCFNINVDGHSELLEEFISDRL